MNHKKLRRLYAEERLQVRRRGGRKRALGTRAPMTLPQGPNQRWSLDFASETLTDGRRFRTVTMGVTATQESGDRDWQGGGSYRPLPECSRLPERGGTDSGCQPAMVRAHSRASALSVMPGNSRRSSTSR